MDTVWILTLTDDRIPNIIGVVYSETEAKQWVKDNTNKHKGWMSKYTHANWITTKVLSK